MKKESQIFTSVIFLFSFCHHFVNTFLISQILNHRSVYFTFLYLRNMFRVYVCHTIHAWLTNYDTL